MFKPDIPSNIIEHTELSYQQKTFLLWCFIRSHDNRYNLFSRRQNCAARDRTIQWYADCFCVHRPDMSKMLADLRVKGIIKTEEEGTRNECTYVDFTVF